MGAHLQPLALRLLALTFPLVAKGFPDETLEKAAKSEGYCSRILRAQGTRREGYNEFSLRVEGDPEFYKPGNSYRGKLDVPLHPVLTIMVRISGSGAVACPCLSSLDPSWRVCVCNCVG